MLEAHEGAGEELAGTTKNAVGGLIGDDRMEAEGTLEAQRGKVRHRRGLE